MEKIIPNVGDKVIIIPLPVEMQDEYCQSIYVGKTGVVSKISQAGGIQDEIVFILIDNEITSDGKPLEVLVCWFHVKSL